MKKMMRICDIYMEKILKKHKHMELESIFNKIAVKLVDQEIFEELKRKKNEHWFWATVDLKAAFEECIKQKEIIKMHKEWLYFKVFIKLI